MWRVKTKSKFKNSFSPVLVYWNSKRIHLNTFEKYIFVPMVPPLLQSCLFIFNSVFWYLPIKTDMSSMDFDLDSVNPEGLDEKEEGEGVNQPHSGEH